MLIEMPNSPGNLPMTLYRKCSGPCARVLSFDPTDTRASITSFCVVCQAPVEWRATSDSPRGGKKHAVAMNEAWKRGDYKDRKAA